jgi:hypothetical protein
LDIYIVDGTYELFRHYYALPSARDSDGREVAAVRGVLSSVLGMIRSGATHIAVATDHVVESRPFSKNTDAVCSQPTPVLPPENAGKVPLTAEVELSLVAQDTAHIADQLQNSIGCF